MSSIISRNVNKQLSSSDGLEIKSTTFTFRKYFFFFYGFSTFIFHIYLPHLCSGVPLRVECFTSKPFTTQHFMASKGVFKPNRIYHYDSVNLNHRRHTVRRHINAVPIYTCFICCTFYKREHQNIETRRDLL